MAPTEIDFAVLLKGKMESNCCEKYNIWNYGGIIKHTLMASIIIWVVLPIIFMLSIDVQTFMVFLPVNFPMNANFLKPENHDITGVHNFYITTVDNNTNTLIDIGIWLVLPETEINATTTSNIREIIRNTNYDILIYLHGVMSNRARAIEQYRVLRKEFLIIAVDHRGYGDSGLDVPMTEAGIAYDHLQIYNWVRSANSAKDIYYWGHSLGAGISTSTLKLLKEKGYGMPKGVILESPFTSFEDIVKNIIFGRLFTWLHYFDTAVLNPLNQNGFHFRSHDNVRSIDCPIMILHAEDDNIVPYLLGKNLAGIAKQNRRNDQGTVIFYGFMSEFGFGHNDITQYPQIGVLIDNFKTVCRNFSTSFRKKIIRYNM